MSLAQRDGILRLVEDRRSSRSRDQHRNTAPQGAARAKTSNAHPGAWYLSISTDGRIAWGPVWYDDGDLQPNAPGFVDPQLDRQRPFPTFERAYRALKRFYGGKIRLHREGVFYQEVRPT